MVAQAQSCKTFEQYLGAIFLGGLVCACLLVGGAVAVYFFLRHWHRLRRLSADVEMVSNQEGQGQHSLVHNLSALDQCHTTSSSDTKSSTAKIESRRSSTEANIGCRRESRSCRLSYDVGLLPIFLSSSSYDGGSERSSSFVMEGKNSCPCVDKENDPGFDDHHNVCVQGADPNYPHITPTSFKVDNESRLHVTEDPGDSESGIGIHTPPPLLPSPAVLAPGTSSISNIQ